MWIDEVASDLYLNSLFIIVASIDTLTSLTLRMSSNPRDPIGTVFCSLTNLQSLSLLISARGLPRRFSSVCVSQLTRLTSLALEGLSIQGSIAPLGELSHLSLEKVPPQSEDLNSALTQLTKLTELLWNDKRLPTLSNHVLSQLKRVQRLILYTQDDVDLEFFQSLASLSDLKSLEFWGLSDQVRLDSFRMQFTVLTQLQELELYCGCTEFDVVGLFGEGTFPRLRYLKIGHPKLEEGDEQKLFNRFPCLRSFKAVGRMTELLKK